MLTIEVPTTSFSEPSSRRRSWARRGEPPSQKVPYPASSAARAASPASSSLACRKEVQTPHSPKSMTPAYGGAIVGRPFDPPKRGTRRGRRRRVLLFSDQRKEGGIILSHMLLGT